MSEWSFFHFNIIDRLMERLTETHGLLLPVCFYFCAAILLRIDEAFSAVMFYMAYRWRKTTSHKHTNASVK